MKKFILVALMLALCVSLCACGEGAEPLPTNPGTQPGAASTAPNAPEGTAAPGNTVPEGTTAAPTEPAHEHSYKQTVTAPDCVNGGYTTNTCDCGDTYVSDEVAATGHAWTDATCTAPKTCSVCAATEGDVAAHSWSNGACTGCGTADPSFKALTDGAWKCKKISSEGYLTEQTLNFAPTDLYETPMWHVSHTESISGWDEESKKEMMDMHEKGEITLKEFNGEYFFGAMGDLGSITFTTEGDMIYVTLEYWDSTLTLQRTAGDQLTVTAMTGMIHSAMGELAAGEVFTWYEK